MVIPMETQPTPETNVVDRNGLPRQEPVAIIGMACRFPGASSLAEFWGHLVAGANMVTKGPPGSVIGRAGRLYPQAAADIEALRYGAFIDELDQFDAEFFRISPLEAQMLDPQQRLMLEVSWRALEDAAIDPGVLVGSRTGIYAGISNTDYRDMAINTPETVDPAAGFYAVTGTALNTAIGRVSFALGLEGPSMAIDTACSSSLVAVHQAAAALERREADLALAGGVHVFLAARPLELRADSGMLSPTGQCWTFDADADGFVCGEGCGLVVLKRLSDAEAAGDRIWAVIRGSSVNQDGASQGLTVPSGASQERAMLEALRRGGIAPGDADYLEAHGTGTAVGDPVELSAASAVYGHGRDVERPILVGSVKTNIGHLGPAAGVAGLVKTVLAMRHGLIPRHLNFKRPNPRVDWDRLPVRVTDDMTEWPRRAGRRPVAGVNSFGWSGTNAHVVVEGYGAPDPGELPVHLSAPTGAAMPVAADVPLAAESKPAQRQTRLLTLSGRSSSAVRDSAVEYLRWLDEHSPGLVRESAAAGSVLSDMAWTAATGRRHFGDRTGVVFSDVAQLRSRLEDIAAGDHPSTSSPLRRAPRTAFAFTGQASQWVGMGQALYEAEPAFRSVLDRCDRELTAERGVSLIDVMFGRGPADGLLDEPAWTQPAVYSLECALVALWASVGVIPDMVVGHSLGEIAAAQAAGALTLSQGLRFAAARGALMGATRSDGAMAAVFAPADHVEAAVVAHNATSQDTDVSIAVDNGVQQVISGPAAAVEALLGRFEAEAVKVVRLRRSPAYHSALVEPVLDDLEAAFAAIVPDPLSPSVALVSNLTGRVLDPGERMDAGYWRRHARAPVAFGSCVETLAAMDVDLVIEIGPAAVLGPLVSMTWPASAAGPAVVQSLQRPSPEMEAPGAEAAAADASGGFLPAVAASYEAGADIDFAGLFAGEARRRVAVPGYPFQRVRHWVPASKRRRRDAGHALLGTRRESPRGEIAFETEVFPSEPAWMPDHLVYDRVVAPGGMYGAMAISAALGEGSGPVAVDDMQLHSALVFDTEDPDSDTAGDDGCRKLQLVLDGDADESSRRFEIFSKGDAEQGWTLHAEGRLARGGGHEGTDTVDLDEVRARLEPQDIADFYRARSADKIYLGPSYRTLKTAWTGEGEALGEVELADCVDTAGMEVHPLLLDGCFQVLSLARYLTGVEHGAVYMPFGWEQLWVTGPLPERMICHAQIRRPAAGSGAEADSASPPEVMTGDVRIYSEHGTPIGALTGFTVKRATRTALLSAGEGLKNLLYEVDWREQPAAERLLRADFLANASEAGDRVQPFTDHLAGMGVELADRAALLADLERLSQAYALAALERLGWERTAGAVLSSESLRSVLRTADEHRRLLGRLLEILADAGVLSRRDDGYAVVMSAGDRLADEALADPEALAEQLARSHPGGVNELGLLRRCGAALADVLRGTLDPLPLLFSDDEPSAADLYLTAPAALAANRMLGETVAAAVDGLPPDRRLRVLEVGAGTGSATESLLSVLPAGRFDYAFTDISAGFFAQAEARLTTTDATITYERLDIEEDPEAQGFDAHGYDIVVAANVLHATRDLASTLSHCRDLLAPSGQLIALEGLKRRAWQDLTFGLLDGWWRFADAYRSDHALASAPVWRRVLADAGFGDVGFPGSPDADTEEPLGSSVIVARGPATVPCPPGLWVLAADGGSMADQLAVDLSSRGQTVIVAASATASAGADIGAAAQPQPGLPGVTTVVVDEMRRESWKRLFETLPADLPLQGVVHLAAVDGHGAEASTWEMADDVRRACESALALSQGIIDAGVTLAGGVWFVTRGGQILPDGVHGDLVGDPAGRQSGQLAGAALWGFGRVMAMEEPHLQPRLIDLDPAHSDTAAADLADEVLFGDAETHVAHRGGRRHAARLVRSGGRRLELPEEPEWFIGPHDPEAGLDALGVNPSPRRSLGSGEARIAVDAMGLSYVDMLLSVGAVPSYAEVGREVCGRVIELGPGVEGLSVGERVAAIGFGAFTPELVAHTDLIAPAPTGLSDAAVASMPTCAVAADLAFGLAELKAGERVLIHAGSGGVGFAAIQLAHAAGAEVFATASAPKQPFLRSLGVAHVYDSRRIDFGEEILRATGGEGVEVVLNSLTGEGFIEASLSCLGRGGRFVEISQRDIWDEDRMSASRPDVAYSVLNVGRLKSDDPQTPGASLSRIMARLADGELAPIPHTVWPLAEIRSAMDSMRAARHIGKNVLRMPPLSRGELRPDRTYLVTGGLGGIGCEVARWLAGRGAGAIVLNGRREPDPAAAEAIRELRRDGADVWVEVADMTNPAAVDAMLARIDDTLPPLGGVIHSVGVLSDGVIENQTWDRFTQVLWPKVLGAWHLHQATKDADLDMFVLFSSVTGVMGNSGQANHAAANAFLDQLAAHRRALGLPGQAIAWGAWSGVGEAEEHRERIETQLAHSGAGWITPAQGIKALDWLVRQDVTAATVTAVEWPLAASRMEAPPPFFDGVLASNIEPERRSGRSGRAELPAQASSSLLRDAPVVDQSDQLVALIQQELTAVMRLTSLPSPTANFFDLGMDSLMAVELRNRINRALAGESSVSNTAVFDYPDAASLAEHLAEQLDDTAAPAPVPQRSAPTIRPEIGQGDEQIAIVGMACRFPGAPDIDAFWRRLEEGADTVTDGRPDSGVWEGVLGDPDATDPLLRRGAFVEDIDGFDAKFFGIAPIEARTMDPTQRMLLETSWHALEDAGMDPDGLKGSRTGVYAGVGVSEYRDLIASRGQHYSYVGTNTAVTVGRVAFTLGLQGPAMPLDMACASSLAAVHQAVASLQRNEIDLAFAGGVNATLSVGSSGFLRDHGLLSVNGRCRAFDAAADGYVRGEGCGMVVLKRLSDAEADGDRIWGVVLGSSVNQNGASAGLLAPNGPAQERVIIEALARAGVDSDDVDYLEAHCVGSEFGDPIEMNALASVFGQDRDTERPLLVGSVKTNIGHLEAASGTASLIKTVLAMRRGVIPATLHFSDLSPHADWASVPMRVVSQKVDWPASTDRLPVAAINSFGLSGTNAHVVLRGYQDPSADLGALWPVGAAQPVSSAPPESDGNRTGSPVSEHTARTTRLLPLSGKSPAALRAVAGQYLEWLGEHDDALSAETAEPSRFLADMAWTALAGRRHFRHRAGLVFSEAAQLRQGLEELARSDAPSEAAKLPGAAKVAFAYSETNDEVLDAARRLYETEPVVRQMLVECDELLTERGGAGPSLLETVSGDGSDDWRVPGPLATYALQCALTALWRSVGVSPAVVIASGLGKVAAAQAAGAISLKQGMRAVAAHCELTAGQAVHVNGAGPDDPDGILSGIALAPPSVTMVSADTGRTFGRDEVADVSYWDPDPHDSAAPLDSAGALHRLGVNALIQIGSDPEISGRVLESWPASQSSEAVAQPPVVLASLPPRRDDSARTRSSGDFAEAVAQAFEAGFSISPGGLFGGEARRRVSLPGYPFQRVRHWVDPPKTG
ncbi:MAG: SDR family NAD(P)-dependent oxidoreductase [Acidimicrobiales bacterium]|nr:SDR family NAD(P)-dependent oxidoreductase [Acidimicrobiales bacterium]MYI10527.1 SDR family NAD(P)-dependent oxidoreductase [Acidimicrobiales bacterium]